jgi:hypothetical protein
MDTVCLPPIVFIKSDPVTPAMEAGISDHVWDLAELIQ